MVVGFKCAFKEVLRCENRVPTRRTIVCKQHDSVVTVNSSRCALSRSAMYPTQRYRKLEFSVQESVMFDTFEFAYEGWHLHVFEDEASKAKAMDFVRGTYRKPDQKILELVDVGSIVAEWATEVPLEPDRREHKVRPCATSTGEPWNHMPRVRRKTRGGAAVPVGGHRRPSSAAPNTGTPSTSSSQHMVPPSVSVAGATPSSNIGAEPVTPTTPYDGGVERTSLRSPSAMSTSSMISPRNGTTTTGGHKRKCSRCSISSQRRSRSSSPSPSDDDMSHQRKHRRRSSPHVAQRRRSSLLAHHQHQHGPADHHHHQQHRHHQRRGSPSSSVSPSAKPMHSGGRHRAEGEEEDTFPSSPPLMSHSLSGQAGISAGDSTMSDKTPAELHSAAGVGGFLSDTNDNSSSSPMFRRRQSSGSSMNSVPYQHWGRRDSRMYSVATTPTSFSTSTAPAPMTDVEFSSGGGSAMGSRTGSIDGRGGFDESLAASAKERASSVSVMDMLKSSPKREPIDMPPASLSSVLANTSTEQQVAHLKEEVASLRQREQMLQEMWRSSSGEILKLEETVQILEKRNRELSDEVKRLLSEVFLERQHTQNEASIRKEMQQLCRCGVSDRSSHNAMRGSSVASVASTLPSDDYDHHRPRSSSSRPMTASAASTTAAAAAMMSHGNQSPFLYHRPVNTRDPSLAPTAAASPTATSTIDAVAVAVATAQASTAANVTPPTPTRSMSTSTELEHNADGPFGNMSDVGGHLPSTSSGQSSSSKYGPAPKDSRAYGFSGLSRSSSVYSSHRHTSSFHGSLFADGLPAGHSQHRYRRANTGRADLDGDIDMNDIYPTQVVRPRILSNEQKELLSSAARGRLISPNLPGVLRKKPPKISPKVSDPNPTFDNGVEIGAQRLSPGADGEIGRFGASNAFRVGTSGDNGAGAASDGFALGGNEGSGSAVPRQFPPWQAAPQHRDRGVPDLFGSATVPVRSVASSSHSHEESILKRRGGGGGGGSYARPTSEQFFRSNDRHTPTSSNHEDDARRRSDGSGGSSSSSQGSSHALATYDYSQVNVAQKTGGGVIPSRHSPQVRGSSAFSPSEGLFGSPDPFY